MAMFFLFLSIFLFVYIWRFIIRSRHVSPSPSTPSTLTTAQPQVIKYDVFLSFRGVDTRSDFTSHLYAALNRKQILTFIDYQLVRGDEISASLLRTIEEAKLSVIVFSENYASSKWCLEELAKIFERRKNNGQIVIPVFYQVDPSHVRNQTGRFGDAFARLIKKKALTMDKEQSFRDALTDAANLSGWSLGKSELESEFIEKIVGDVLNKLHAMSSSHTTGLFGIDARIHKVESLLNMESQDVLIVGIWGMGGIGKTTIAEAVCNKVRSRFEGIFVANFRQELKARPMADLQRSFLSQLLGQEILKMGSLSFRDSFVRDRLRRKMVFIVLDDVDDLMALEEWKELLHGRHSSFGRGSKVLITSRDRQVLSNIVDETYKVERLNYEEALQLFSSKALKNCIPTIDHRDLIKRIASHVQGNPLALIVLGSSLYGKSPEEWYSALNKLAQNPRIENALRISYNGLDQEQQSIFLDIAHFFRKFEQNQATRILDGFYGRPVIFDISMLINKGLITTSRNMLEIHDLLQEMAFNIVRAESKFPGKRSRLCHLTDIVHVLEENKGAEEIEGISLDMSRLSRQIQLKSDAFAMMDGLRFIKFFFGHLSQDNKDKMQLPPTGLEYLSNKLRYLHWDGFPSKSLPHVFCAEHLVELNLSRSKVEKLWTGVQDVGNLRKFVLSYSPYLMELPDLSKARNLVSLHLVDCPSLTEVPLSLQYLDKLEELDLNFCYNLRSFPMLDSKVLKVLSISRCLDVTKCPTISQNMKSLYLEETSIKEVPQSITSKLENLGLHGCSKITKFPEISGDVKTLYLSGTAIKEVPSSIQFLTRLRVLDMSGCSKLESFPEITVPMKSLVDLNLSKTGIKEVPSSIQFLTRLEKLDMRGCSELESFPEITVPMESLEMLFLSRSGIKEIPSISFKHMISLRVLHLDGTPLKEVPSSIQFLTRLEKLDMRGCSELESFPEITVPMESLQSLRLSKTGIKEIPSISFKHMISLRVLYLDGTPLKELPSSIQFLTRLGELDMSGCSELESFPEITVPMKSLKSLRLSKTGMKEIPSIQFLTVLEKLDMSGCSELESFPEITVPIKSLHSLRLSETGIKEIPSISFKHMISLRFLFLDGTPIKELPLSIKDMVRLQYQYLHGTPIKELPLSIKDMVCLQHLTFHGTAIKALPELPSSLTLGFQRDFTNCFKLDQKPLVAAMHLKIQVSL
ncbi:PREDICTED: protein SUPPRESSOR OF npr1-1, CONSTITUTIVE 1-like isoform X4 [Populus euphratica]|uniref:Protein SUPPRESSOR OF npr1-1, CONSTITUTIVE 1-like isoform X4 n=1 Tax=Populus euphratica TaxID=75702 RepID=A0AAJ6X2E4_POPEU|nr:PREDICTED: protein SUPPRESSOR OF npr1-1, CONSTITUTIVE 1-like isoform X4 [Populus euphratica]